MGGTREAEGQHGTAHLVIPPVLVRVVAVAIPHGELYPVASMVCVVCCIRVAKEANGRADLGRLPAQRRLKDMRAIKLDCDGRVLSAVSYPPKVVTDPPSMASFKSR